MKAKVINMLSADLMMRYGSDSGYSIRNLKYMRQFAVEYPDFPFVQVPLALGVAAYKTKELIENLKSSLPSIDDLEKKLND